jgi:hypothetical protein
MIDQLRVFGEKATSSLSLRKYVPLTKWNFMCFSGENALSIYEEYLFAI